MFFPKGPYTPATGFQLAVSQLITGGRTSATAVPLLPPPVFVRTKIIKSVQTLEEEKIFSSRRIFISC